MSTYSIQHNRRTPSCSIYRQNAAFSPPFAAPPPDVYGLIGLKLFVYTVTESRPTLATPMPGVMTAQQWLGGSMRFQHTLTVRTNNIRERIRAVSRVCPSLCAPSCLFRLPVPAWGTRAVALPVSGEAPSRLTWGTLNRARGDGAPDLPRKRGTQCMPHRVGRRHSRQPRRGVWRIENVHKGGATGALPARRGKARSAASGSAREHPDGDAHAANGNGGDLGQQHAHGGQAHMLEEDAQGDVDEVVQWVDFCNILEKLRHVVHG